MNPYHILGIVVGYFAVLLIISKLTSRGADNAGFFIGNKKSPWYIVAIGMIGASLSGVTFISVPGWVGDSNFYYMQMVFGYLLGYAVIIHVLMPLYYRLNLTSIYTYLDQRFGKIAYKAGATFFLISRIVGASFRLFLVANVLHLTIFEKVTVFGGHSVPFVVTVIITLALIWVYTFRGGIKTIVWTDTLQTSFMILAVILSIAFIGKSMDLSFGDLVREISQSGYGDMFDFSGFRSKSFFFKQFITGAFITIVMTGLDQDMMQKNLSCRNLKDAQKNMFWYSLSLVPVNLLFLSLGALLFIYAHESGIALPERADNLYPLIATGGYLPEIIGYVFILGLIAAAYSSADSALTSLTTSFTVDILDSLHLPEEELRKVRIWVHVGMSCVLAIVIMVFEAFNDDSVISALFKAAGYTYGPLLGMYAFGLFVKLDIKERFLLPVVTAAPILSYLLSYYSPKWFAYSFGYEILLVNGILCFLGMLVISKKQV